jgi:hypothetical protein
VSEEKPAPPSSSSPLLLGFVGLLLILGGWKLTTWVPPSHDDALFNEVRRLADDGLRAKLDGYRRPPLELPGRLALFAGLGLFVVAGVKMYRAPAAPAEAAENLHGISSPSERPKADAHL